MSGSVILLAYHYPPMVGPASQRAASFARHLPESGWDPVVVTAKRGLYHAHAGHEAPAAPVVRTRSPEPTRLLRRLRPRAEELQAGEEVVPALGGRAVPDRMRRLVRDYLYVPDAQAPWIPFAISAARRALRAAPGPAVLMSSSVPYSAHLAARAVARSEGVPWVAELRDPWSLLDDRIRPRSRGRKRIDAALEARVVAAASGIVLTSEQTRELMVEAYPALEGRAWVVRNGFEPSTAPVPSPPGQDAPLGLVHAGTAPPDAPVGPLLKGIDRVARARPGEVSLRIVGPPEPWRAAAGELGGLDWLTLVGVAEPAAAQEAVASSSAAVLLRPGEANRQVVAAKLLDYLGAQRPVLAFVSAGGEMAALGRDYGDLRLVGDYDEAAVAEAVEALLAEHRSGLLQRPAEGRRPVAELTRRAQAARLAAVLDSVL